MTSCFLIEFFRRVQHPFRVVTQMPTNLGTAHIQGRTRHSSSYVHEHCACRFELVKLCEYEYVSVLVSQFLHICAWRHCSCLAWPSQSIGRSATCGHCWSNVVWHVTGELFKQYIQTISRFNVVWSLLKKQVVTEYRYKTKFWFQSWKDASKK